MKFSDLTISQLRVLWIAIGVLVFSFVYSPWKVGMGTYGRSYSEGYSLVITPPHGAVGIDLERVLLQTAMIVPVAFGAIATLAVRSKKSIPVVSDQATGSASPLASIEQGEAERRKTDTDDAVEAASTQPNKQVSR